MTVNDQSSLLDRPQHDEESMTVSNDLRIGKLALASLLLACFLANADESFILTTGNDVAAALNASEFTAWLITVYNLGYTTALPLYGQICDLTGPKKAILFALTLYGSGCIMTGLSSTIHLALAGRIVSGLGGSGMVELVSVLMSEMGNFHQVAVFRSYVSIASTLGVTCGAPLGALLTSLIGWQWAFFIHVPFAVLCIIVVSFGLSIEKPKSHNPTERIYGAIDNSKKYEAKSKPKAFDIAGLVFVMTAIVCLLGFIQVILREEMSNKSIVLAILGVTFSVCFVAFFVNEAYVATYPFIPLCLLKPDNLGLIYADQLFIGLANSAMIPMLSDYWVSIRGFSAAEGAMCWAPATFGLGFGSLITGRLIQSSRRYLLFSKIGITLACSSFLLMLIRWALHEPKMWEILYSFPAWVGMGMTLSSQFVALSAAKPDQNVASSVTTFYVLQQIGFMAGVTTAKALIRRTIEHRLRVAFGESVGSRELIEQILSHRRSLTLVPLELQNIVRKILQESYYIPPVIAITSLLLGFYICFRQREVKST